MTDGLDGLRTKAEEMAVDDDLTRRPTWAPRLLLGEELIMLLYELEWLDGNEKAVARLWATFTDPRRGKVRCEGFELRAGETHTGQKIFTAQYYDKAAVIERLKDWMEKTKNPDARKHYEDAIHTTEQKIGGWSFGPNYTWSRQPGRLEKLRHATELAKERVMDFAGAPVEQMRAAGKYFGHCCCCGKALTDPQSIELGIGPECRHKFRVTVANAPGPWIIGGNNIEKRPKQNISTLATDTGRVQRSPR